MDAINAGLTGIWPQWANSGSLDTGWSTLWVSMTAKACWIQGHAGLLDSFGGQAHLELLNRVDELANQWAALRSELNRLHRDERERNRRIDLLTFQVEEISKAALQAGEDEN